METFATAPGVYSPINSYITLLLRESDLIPEERKTILWKLSSYIETTLQARGSVKLTFICTHNSRRSHLSQVWAQTAAYYYGLTGIETYSGGTETTAFNPRAVKALQNIGFKVEKSDEITNPVYLVKFSHEIAPLKAYSKIYDAAGNPTEYFAAIMTCSQADEACPFIPGAELRIAIAYDDPKNADGTSQEEAIYDERTRQIAREMLFAFSLVKPATA